MNANTDPTSTPLNQLNVDDFITLQPLNPNYAQTNFRPPINTLQNQFDENSPPQFAQPNFQHNNAKLYPPGHIHQWSQSIPQHYSQPAQFGNHLQPTLVYQPNALEPNPFRNYRLIAQQQQFANKHFQAIDSTPIHTSASGFSANSTDSTFQPTVAQIHLQTAHPTASQDNRPTNDPPKVHDQSTDDQSTGDQSIQPFETGRDNMLADADYFSILNQHEASEQKIPMGSIGWPCSGDIYLVAHNDLKYARDVKDLYNWKFDSKLQSENIIIYKYRFGFKDEESRRFKYTSAFKKWVVHARLTSKNLSLVHYFGDLPEQYARKTHPHGNAKKQETQIVKRAFHSQSAELKDQLKTVGKTSTNHLRTLDTVRQQISTTENLNPQLATDIPRGTKQIANFKYNQLLAIRSSRDMLNNIRSLKATNMKHFLRRMVSENHFEIHLASDQTVKLANDLIKTKHNVLFNLDTTFNLTDGFVTPVVTKNLHFKTEPLFPVAFLIHERKFESTHLSFLLTIFPKLIKLKPNVGFMTDREWSLQNAVKKLLLLFGNQDNQLLCGFHISRNVKRHAESRTKAIMKRIKKEDKKDAGVLVDEEGLIDSTLKEEHSGGCPNELGEPNPLPDLSDPTGKEELRRLVRFKNDFYQLREQTDSATFEAMAERMSSQWNDQEQKYFNKHLKADLISNLTNRQNFPVKQFDNNISESFNAFMKRFFGSRKQSLDTLVLALHRISMHYIETFNKGYSGLGDIDLKNEFAHLHGQSYPINLKLNIESELKQVNDGFKLIDKKDQNKLPKNCGQLYLAELLFRDHEIAQIGHRFIVPTPTDDKRPDDWPMVVVTLDKEGKLKCCCELNGSCCHLMAVQLKLGQQVSAESQDLDHTGLKRKSEFVKSGRKGGDEDEAAFAIKKQKKAFKSEDIPLNSEDGIRLGDQESAGIENMLQADLLEDDLFSDSMLQDALNSNSFSANLHLDCTTEPQNGDGTIALSDTSLAYQPPVEHPAIAGFTDKSKLTDEQIRIFVEKELTKSENEETIFVPSIEVESEQLFNYLFHNLNENVQNVLVLFNTGDDVHWLAGIIKLNQKQIVILDSFLIAKNVKGLSGYSKYFEKLVFICDVIDLIRGAPRQRSKRRESQRFELLVAQNAPQQKDNFNCSVFYAAYFYMFLNEQATLQVNASEFRAKIKHQILDQSIPQPEMPEKAKLPKHLIDAKSCLRSSAVKPSEFKFVEFLNVFI